MDLKDCAKFANENPVCSVATVEGDQPRVRIYAMWYADESGFYFQTGAPKPSCHQLQDNHKVEVCFYAPGPNQMPGPMLRVAGEAEFLDDRSLRERALNDRPFLKAMGITGPDDTNLVIFRIPRGECEYWQMGPDFKENVEMVKF